MRRRRAGEEREEGGGLAQGRGLGEVGGTGKSESQSVCSNLAWLAVSVGERK